MTELVITIHNMFKTAYIVFIWNCIVSHTCIYIVALFFEHKRLKLVGPDPQTWWESFNSANWLIQTTMKTTVTNIKQ